MNRWGTAIAFAVFGALGCTADIDEPAAAPPVSALEAYRQGAAAELAALLGDDAVRDRVVADLAAGPAPLSSYLTTDTASLVGTGASPELWLRPGGDELLVAYAPGGDERTWTSVPAYTLDGRRVALDLTTPPEASVIVVETHGRAAFHESIAEANAALRRAGLQRAPEASAAAAGKWTIRLDRIALRDDLEPWISGDAEIYAIASGVVGDNQPELRIVELPYLDDDGTAYFPNQIIVDWSAYGYQAVNVQLFEHDDNTSYQTLVQALVAAVGAVGSLAGYPVVQAITEIANRVIAAMPASWFANDDDYVDSFYTLEKNRSYSAYQGVSRNATVHLSPYYLAPN